MEHDNNGETDTAMPIREIAMESAKDALRDTGEEGLDYKEYVDRMRRACFAEDFARLALRDLRFQLDADGYVRARRFSIHG